VRRLHALLALLPATLALAVLLAGGLARGDPLLRLGLLPGGRLLRRGLLLSQLLHRRLVEGMHHHLLSLFFCSEEATRRTNGWMDGSQNRNRERERVMGQNRGESLGREEYACGVPRSIPTHWGDLVLKLLAPS
jgi:hypothetical protein